MPALFLPAGKQSQTESICEASGSPSVQGQAASWVLVHCGWLGPGQPDQENRHTSRCAAESAEGSGVQQYLSCLQWPNGNLCRQPKGKEDYLPGKATGICLLKLTQKGLGRIGQWEHTASHVLSLRARVKRGLFPINLVSEGRGGALDTQHIHMQYFHGKGKGTLTWLEPETVTTARVEAQPMKDPGAWLLHSHHPSSSEGPILGHQAWRGIEYGGLA